MASKNSNDLCRLCLSENSVTVPISSKENLLDVKIKTCLPLLQVRSDDFLPKKICLDCVEKLNDTYTFLTSTYEAQKKLFDWFASVNEEEEQPRLLKVEELHLHIDELLSDHQLTSAYYKEETLVLAEDLVVDGNFKNATTSYDLPVFQKPSKVSDNKNCKTVMSHTTVPGNEQSKSTPHFCNTCHMFFPKEFMRNHMLSHPNPKPYTCEVCKKEFSQPSHLKSHSVVHQNKKLISSEANETGEAKIYEIPFTAKGALANALKGSLNITVCTVCGTKFKTPFELRYHRKVHSEEKPYPCVFCYQTFKTLRNLEIHESKHLNITPFQCSVCDKKFDSWGILNRHQTIHTATEMFTCELCGQLFGTASDLKYHAKDHEMTTEQ